jgi:hypothetical protein
MLIILAGGCGRWGFSDGIDARPGGDAIDAATIDMSGVTTASFGERAGATYTGVTSDTMLSSTQPTANYGKEDTVSTSSTATALLRFDTSMLPPSTQVVSASISIVTEDMGLSSGSTEIYVVNEAWTEGTAMGAAGVANYTMRTAGQTWSNAGAGPPTSRATTVLATFVPSAISTEYVVPLNAAGVAAVQAWIDMPVANFGVAFGVTGGGSWAFQSQETTSTTRRPLLIISYK